MTTRPEPLLALTLVSALAACTWPSLARAESRLAYHAPAGCPSEAELVAAIRSRGGEFSASSNATTLALSVREEPGGFAGSFRIEGAGASSDAREVHGQSCRDVVDALAVVVALALRPDAEPAKPAALQSQRTEGDAPSAPPAPPARPPLEAAHVWPQPFRPGDSEVAVKEGTLRFESVTAVTAFGGVALGIVPGVAMPRLDVSLTRANFVTPPDGASYLVGPIWRIRASLLGDTTHRSGDLRTRVGGQSVGAGLCYSPLFDASGLQLLLCLDLAVGILGVETRDAADAVVRSKTIGSGTLGAGVEPRYSLGRHVHLALKAGADVPTVPVTAERADDSRIFRSSPVIGYGMIGIGGHW